MTRKVSELVWFSIKPEAGGWLVICFPDARSVGVPAFDRLNHLEFKPAENWIAPYSDQVPPWPKFLLLPQTSVFLSLSLVQVKRFFHQQYLHTIIFRFSSHIFLSSLGGFSLIDIFVRFSSLVSPHWVGRFFTSNMILFWDSSTSLRGYDVLIGHPVFLLSLPLFGLRGFSPSSHSRLPFQVPIQDYL